MPHALRAAAGRSLTLTHAALAARERAVPRTALPLRHAFAERGPRHNAEYDEDEA